MHITVRRGLPVEEAALIGEEVDRRVHEGTEPGFCVIHVDAESLAEATPAGPVTG